MLALARRTSSGWFKGASQKTSQRFSSGKPVTGPPHSGRHVEFGHEVAAEEAPVAPIGTDHQIPDRGNTRDDREPGVVHGSALALPMNAQRVSLERGLEPRLLAIAAQVAASGGFGSYIGAGQEQGTDADRRGKSHATDDHGPPRRKGLNASEPVPVPLSMRRTYRMGRGKASADIPRFSRRHFFSRERPIFPTVACVRGWA